MENNIGNRNYSIEKVKLQLADSGRKLADLTASMVYDNPELLKPLLEICWLDEDPFSQRASRVVSICCCEFPILLSPYLNQIISGLKRQKSEAVRRNFLKIFMEVPVKLTDRNKEILLNLCFEYLSGNYSVGVKVYSMDILYNLSKDLPEIQRELYYMIEEQITNASAGFKSRGERILKKIGLN